jgi:hypothetical protein
LFFRVRPGHENDLRAAVEALQDSPGYRPGDYEMPIASIHEARFVLFDGDTRLLFATSFDGPWDSYMEDFAAKPRSFSTPSSGTSRAMRASRTSPR